MLFICFLSRSVYSSATTYILQLRTFTPNTFHKAATGGTNGKVKVWDLSTGTCRVAFQQAHKTAVTALTWLTLRNVRSRSDHEGASECIKSMTNDGTMSGGAAAAAAASAGCEGATRKPVGTQQVYLVTANSDGSVRLYGKTLYFHRKYF